MSKMWVDNVGRSLFYYLLNKQDIQIFFEECPWWCVMSNSIAGWTYIHIFYGKIAPADLKQTLVSFIILRSTLFRISLSRNIQNVVVFVVRLLFFFMKYLMLLPRSHHTNGFYAPQLQNMMILLEMKIKFVDSFLPEVIFSSSAFCLSFFRFGWAYYGLLDVLCAMHYAFACLLCWDGRQCGIGGRFFTAWCGELKAMAVPRWSTDCENTAPHKTVFGWVKCYHQTHKSERKTIEWNEIRSKAMRSHRHYIIPYLWHVYGVFVRASHSCVSSSTLLICIYSYYTCTNAANNNEKKNNNGDDNNTRYAER